MSTPNGVAKDVTKTNKPKDSAFRQQRLPAWQPILTAHTVIPVFFLIGISFIPAGVMLFMESEKIQEVELEYTMCTQKGVTSISCIGNGTASSANNAEEFIKNAPGASCTCTLLFNLEAPFEGDVLIYYGLTNFYQNHRRYVKSRDDKQLRGNILPPDDLNSDCDPYKTGGEFGNLSIVPCGAVANSMFNDTFNLAYKNTGDEYVSLKWSGRNIAWKSDREVKFKNPSVASGNLLNESFVNTVSPPNWQKPIWQLSSDWENPEKTAENNGFENEDFIVWMRTAAFPNFRKLYRRIMNGTNPTAYPDRNKNGLDAGFYKLTISYNYPVTSFGGKKFFVITTSSWLGGKNPFLGYAYIVVGGLCILTGIVLLAVYCIYGKSAAEMINISNQTPYQ